MRPYHTVLGDHCEHQLCAQSRFSPSVLSLCFPGFHGPHEGGHQEPEAGPALCRNKKELLFNRGKGRERQVPWEGLAGSLPFPASIRPPPGLHLPCRCPLPAVSGAFLWQQLLGADGPQGFGVGQQLAGQKC